MIYGGVDPMIEIGRFLFNPNTTSIARGIFGKQMPKQTIGWQAIVGLSTNFHDHGNPESVDIFNNKWYNYYVFCLILVGR